MNILDKILRVLTHAEWKEASALPGWRTPPTRMHKARTPFQGRARHAVPNNMETLAFTDKDERNARWDKLRKEQSNVFRFSTHQGSKILWCVSYPRN
jgi:hypothetical protein